MFFKVIFTELTKWHCSPYRVCHQSHGARRRALIGPAQVTGQAEKRNIWSTHWAVLLGTQQGPWTWDLTLESQGPFYNLRNKEGVSGSHSCQLIKWSHNPQDFSWYLVADIVCKWLLVVSMNHIAWWLSCHEWPLRVFWVLWHIGLLCFSFRDHGHAWSLLS